MAQRMSSRRPSPRYQFEFKKLSQFEHILYRWRQCCVQRRVCIGCGIYISTVHTMYGHRRRWMKRRVAVCHIHISAWAWCEIKIHSDVMLYHCIIFQQLTFLFYICFVHVVRVKEMQKMLWSLRRFIFISWTVIFVFICDVFYCYCWLFYHEVCTTDRKIHICPIKTQIPNSRPVQRPAQALYGGASVVSQLID